MSKDNMFPDLKIDEIPCDTLGDDKEKKKRVNGNRKGKTYERDVCKDLSKRFGGEFRRVPMSGSFFGGSNFIKNKDVNAAAKDILCGDIITPPGFHWTLECKNYYDTPKMHNLVGDGDTVLDKWIEQAKLESKTAGKPWMIIFKVTIHRGCQYIVIESQDFIRACGAKIHKSIYYNDCFIFDYEYFMDNLAPYFSKTTTSPLINTNSTTGV